MKQLEPRSGCGAGLRKSVYAGCSGCIGIARWSDSLPVLRKEGAQRSQRAAADRLGDDRRPVPVHERTLDERAARPDEGGYRPADGARVACLVSGKVVVATLP